MANKIQDNVKKPGLGMRIEGRLEFFYHKIKDQYSVIFSPDYLIITINSTTQFFLTYFIITFFSQFTTALTAYFFKIHTIIQFNTIDFLINAYDWKTMAIFAVFSSASLLILLISIRSFKLTLKNWHYSRTQRMFFLWLFYQCLTYLIGGLLVGSIFNRRLGIPVGWALHNRVYQLVMVVPAMALMLYIGNMYANLFFSTSKIYFNSLDDWKRKPFLVSQVIFPYLIGNILVALVELPRIALVNKLVNISMIFLIIPIWIRASSFPALHFDDTHRRIRIWWDWVFWTVIITLVIGIILKIKIHI
jgi:hypothetical protein